MRRLALLAVLLAVLDLGLIVGPATPERAEPAFAASALVAAPPVAGRPIDRAAWVETILDRPLFDPARRAPRPPPLPAPEVAVPRLTGTIVANATRRALLAGQSGERVLSIGEGERMGPFTVTSIKAGAVELHGPGGPHVLRLTADAGLRADLVASRPLVALIDPFQRESETETDQ